MLYSFMLLAQQKIIAILLYFVFQIFCHLPSLTLRAVYI